MTTPRNSSVDDLGRRTYAWSTQSGVELYYSVTTMLQAMPKPWLEGYVKKQVAVAAVEAAKDGTLQKLVANDEAGAVGFLRASGTTHRDTARDVGNEVHNYVEAVVLGKTPPTPSPAAAGRCQQFERFCAEYRPEFEMAEATVYNRTEAYAGTLDLLMRVPVRGRPIRFITDTKTAKAVRPEYALQMAAYSRGEFVGLEGGVEAPLPEIDAAAVLLLRPRSFKFTEVRIDDEVFRTFLYAREIYRWMVDLSQRVVLGDVPSVAQEEATLAVALDTFGDRRGA